MTTTVIAQRLQRAREQIAEAARRVGRQPADVTLVAVSKTFPDAVVREARQAGHVDFGESRAQDLVRRTDGGQLTGCRWHFVGRLQRNKVTDVVGRATLIHSVDRIELAHAISAEAYEQGRVQAVLAQVNVAGDQDKAGVDPASAVAFVARIREIPHLACQGVMTMPPLGEDPRPHFAALRELRDQLREKFPEIRHCSMGMSQDFEIAVEEGATIVRVGEAIFGPRES